jgi:hypothetical protein
MFWLSFCQNHMCQKKGKYTENISFRDAANIVWRVLTSVVVFLKSDRSKSHAGPKYMNLSYTGLFTIVPTEHSVADNFKITSIILQAFTSASQ